MLSNKNLFFCSTFFKSRKKLIVININNTYYINYSMFEGILQAMTEVVTEPIIVTGVVQFDTLDLPIPTIVTSYSAEKQREIFEYLSEMHEKERIGYKIAFDHLGTSFDICRSNGFITWKRNKV